MTKVMEKDKCEMKKLILIVEDDEQLVQALRGMLERNLACRCEWAPSCAVARSLLADKIYDLVILDRQLPDGDGLGVVRVGLGGTMVSQVLILSELGQVSQRELGLQAGVFDYLAKPFSRLELLEKVKRLLVANNRLAEVIIQIDERVLFWPEANQLSVDGEYRKLTEAEGKILQCLCEAMRVVSREELCWAVWKNELAHNMTALSTKMCRLRSKLGPARHRLRTYYRDGYQLRRANQPMIDTRIIWGSNPQNALSVE